MPQAGFELTEVGVTGFQLNAKRTLFLQATTAGLFPFVIDSRYLNHYRYVLMNEYLNCYRFWLLIIFGPSIRLSGHKFSANGFLFIRQSGFGLIDPPRSII